MPLAPEAPFWSDRDGWPSASCCAGGGRGSQGCGCVNFPREEYVEHRARAGTRVPKSCGFQPACEMQIVWSTSARAKLRAITGKCGHMALCSYTPRLALALQHWGTPTHSPSQLGAEHSHSACINPGLCPLTSCGSTLHLCRGLGHAGREAVNLGLEKGDEGGVCPVLRGLQRTCPPPAGHGTISCLVAQLGSHPTISGCTL